MVHNMALVQQLFYTHSHSLTHNISENCIYCILVIIPEASLIQFKTWNMSLIFSTWLNKIVKGMIHWMSYDFDQSTCICKDLIQIGFKIDTNSDKLYLGEPVWTQKKCKIRLEKIKINKNSITKMKNKLYVQYNHLCAYHLALPCTITTFHPDYARFVKNIFWWSNFNLHW